MKKLFKPARIISLIVLGYIGSPILLAKTKSSISLQAETEIISYPSKQICEGGLVKLSLSMTPLNATIRWYFNGVVIPGAEQIIYIADQAGKYSATLTNGNEIISVFPISITESDIPKASFTHSSDEKCATAPIRFISTSTGTDLVYHWDFGDPNSQKNNISEGNNPTHLFIGNHGNGVQTYKITLTLSNLAGCYISTAEAEVKLNQTPSTSLGAAELTLFNNNLYFTACTSVPYTFKFFNKSSTSNINYRINWGDKSPNFSAKTFQNTEHTYSPGFYTLFYSVTGLKGCVNTQTYFVYVGKSPQPAVSVPVKKVCINQPLLIKLSEFSPAATNYKVTYSDGVIKTYPKSVDTLLHYFANSSDHKVAITSAGTFNDAYTAIIEASNPCGKTIIDTGPLYVIQFPEKPVVASVINSCIADIPVPLNATAANNNFLNWYSDATLKNKLLSAPAPPTNQVQTHSYYVTQSNATGCESEASEIQVNILPGIENNIIEGDQLLCFADSIQKIVPAATIKGGNNQFEYQWQISADNGITWQTDLLNNGFYDYLPLRRPGVTRYRRLVSSGSCTNLSNEITITIQPEIIDFNILSKDQLLKPGASPTLITASQPYGGAGSFTYQWQSSQDGTIWQDINEATGLNFQPGVIPGTLHYRRITKSGTCVITSNNITIFLNNNIVIPTVFTPNGDGFNDKWVITGFEYSTNLRLKVYNRYGTLVFNSKDNTWDGSYNGSQLPPGVYYYIITSGKTKLGGSVTILL